MGRANRLQTTPGMVSTLKGADSALFRACTALQLRPALYSIYEWRDPACSPPSQRAPPGPPSALELACPFAPLDHRRQPDDARVAAPTAYAPRADVG